MHRSSGTKQEREGIEIPVQDEDYDCSGKWPSPSIEA